MSSQAGEELGQNVVVCYFPWLPYYQRYQIGFDIVVDPSDAEADPSGAAQPQRVIHVQLEFPDGFICGPARSGTRPRTHLSRGVGPRFFRPHPEMLPDFSGAAPQFQHDIPVNFGIPVMCREEFDVCMKVSVENGKPGDFVLIDDIPYDINRQCRQCYDFHRESHHIHDTPSEDDPEANPPEQPEVQSGDSGQQPSTSATTGQGDMSQATAYATIEHECPETGKRVLTRYQLSLPPLLAGDPQNKPHEDFPKNCAVFSGELVAVRVEALQLDEEDQKNDGKAAQPKEERSVEEGVDKATQNDD